MAQELKPPGGIRTWRDEARFRLRQTLGEAGGILGEGFLGESEEDKYLEFLQRTYGSELPRDVPSSRPLGQSFLDPSDFGAIDKLLIPLSGLSSVVPRLALGAGLTETGMLLGDAQGEYDKGNTTAAGIMTALAGLPVALASRGENKDFIGYGKDAVSGLSSFIRNINPAGQRSSMVTPEGIEMPFYEKRGDGIGGLLDNKKLNVTPTKFNRVLTDKDSVDRAAKGGPSNIVNKENVETLLEKSILNNPVQNIDKKYSIKDFLQQTKTNLSKPAQSGFNEQIKQFVSPETLAGRFTIQELLDDIGKNKPTITEQVDDVTPTDQMSTSQYSNFMPFIPKYEIPRDLSEASQTIKPTRYIESNFAINSPTLGKMWEDPGHQEVGTGVLSDDFTSRDSGTWNTANRIFTARSAIYDIGNEKVLIPAESQSGIYGLAEKTNELSLSKQPYSFTYFNDLLTNGRSIRSETGEDIIPFLKPGKSLDDFEELLGELEVDRAMYRSSAFDNNAMPENIKEVIRDEPTVTEDLLNGMLVGQNNTKRFRDGVAGYIRDMKLADTDIANTYARKLSNLTTVGDKGGAAPLFKDWFPLRMKSALNLASEEGVDRVRFPINDYALAMQRGEDLNPAQTRDFMGEATVDPDDMFDVMENTYDPDINPTGEFLKTRPSDKARAMAIKYKNFTDKGIKRIEAEYGVDLNAKVFEDENLNKFYDIEMTPELRKAFEKLVYKNGGLVQKPLMPLKYNY
ncbi:MAG: hypothetical protein CL867_11430 [Cytophagaceae bacterium]|nr:hypothetical protein [Cytophagaceae bacterium]